MRARAEELGGQLAFVCNDTEATLPLSVPLPVRYDRQTRDAGDLGGGG